MAGDALPVPDGPLGEDPFPDGARVFVTDDRYQEPDRLWSGSFGGAGSQLRFAASMAELRLVRRYAQWVMSDLGFEPDAIYDGQLVVETAGEQLVVLADRTAPMLCRFDPAGDSLAVVLSAPSERGQVPQERGYEWQLLRELTVSVRAYGSSAPGRGGITTIELVLPSVALDA